MDCPKFEQSRGLKSKIPVRAIRPPSKLPVPISSKENQSKKNQTWLKSSNVENALSKAQLKPANTLASRGKKNLPSQKARPPVANTAKENHFWKQTEQKSKAIENVSSKTQKNTYKTVPPPTSGARLKNQGYSKAVAVSKNSACSGLQTKTKNSDQPTNKKSLSKGFFSENRRLTDAASRNKNGNLVVSNLVKSSVVNRRLTDISRKNPSQISKNFETNIRNQRITSIESTGMKRNTNFGIQVRKQNFQPVQLKDRNKRNTAEDFFPIDNTPKILNINSTEGEANNKTYFSFDQVYDGFSNIQDVEEKKNNENHFLQSDVEFVPDERCRNQILFGYGISPEVKPKQFKSSLSIRPSFFLKSKAAHLEKLEEDGRRASMLRMSGLSLRPSQPSKCDPIQVVLKALENVDLEAEDRRVSTLKKTIPSYLSPRMQRSPMFKLHVDPCKTALKRIEALQMKKKAKSARKVTFNLESSVSNLKVSEKNEKSALTFSKEVISDYFFEEKKEPCSISMPEPKDTTPELQLPTNSCLAAEKLERNLTQSHYYNMLLRVCDRICSPDKKKHQGSDRIEASDDSSIPDSKIYPSMKRGLQNSELRGTHTNRSTVPAPRETRNSLYLQRRQPVQNRHVSALSLNNPSDRKSVRTMSNTTNKASSTPTLGPALRISESVGPSLRTLGNRLAEPAREDNRYSLYLPRRQRIEPAHEDTRYSLYLPRRPQPNMEEQDPRRSTLSKLCTPRPISFFPKPGTEDNISPEFLCRRTSQIVAHAPISTPMVLRTMAASLEDSLSAGSGDESGQVCQRLDFDDELEEKADSETVRASTGSPFKLSSNTLSILGILTNRQILDNLADEECRSISSFSSLPETTTARNFLNPVARILTHGDDMHFVPLKLR